MATALIVDDNRASGLLLARLLLREGHTPVCACTAAEAWEAMAKFHPKVVLLDIRLPDGNGIDWLRQLREEPAFNDTTVVMVSGVLDLETQAEAFRYGAVDYVVKGTAWSEFWLRLEPLLQEPA